jgi:hypothetical protein
LPRKLVVVAEPPTLRRTPPAAARPCSGRSPGRRSGSASASLGQRRSSPESAEVVPSQD